MKLLRAAGLFVVCHLLAWPASAQTTPPALGIASDPPVVKILSTGEGAKRPLRYRLAKGAKETIELTMDMAISMEVPGVGPQSVDAPPMKMSMDVTVDDITANGDFVLSMTIATASMEGGPLPAGALDGLKGLSAVMTMTDRGLIRSVKFDESKIGDPAMMQLLQSTGFDRLSAPLPEEPIGAGAKWEVTQQVKANGVSMEQRSTYEVLEMARGGATLGVTIAQTAGAQTMSPPGMPPEIQATVVDMKGAGKGRLTLSDGSMTLYGDMAMHSDVTMDITMGGQSQRMPITTEIKMTISPGKRQ